jgi:hypothetical protein
MSYDLRIELSPEALDLLRELPERAAAALPAMARALDLQNELTVGYANKLKMSGPRPEILGRVTSNLARGLWRQEASISGTQVEGSIGDPVLYAGVHEYGFDGDVTVQAHSYIRRNRKKDIFDRKGRLSSASIGYVQVRSFTRHMHMPERSYIRSSISERLADYNDALSGAVLAALGGTP